MPLTQHLICISCKCGKLNICLLLQNLSNEDKLIRTMVIDMKTRFDKYWSDYSDLLYFGCILDSRFKIKLLKYCYSKFGHDPIYFQAKLKFVEHKLYTLYIEYVQMYFKETTSNVDLSQGSSNQLPDNVIDYTKTSLQISFLKGFEI